jgi:hypothetical protein
MTFEGLTAIGGFIEDWLTLVTTHTDIGKARAAVERLAESRE